MPTVGVLALQGDVREHADAVEAIGGIWKRVRRPEDLEGIDALIIPGGESTTIGKLATRYGLDRASPPSNLRLDCRPWAPVRA